MSLLSITLLFYLQHKHQHYFLRFFLLPMVFGEVRLRPITFVWVSASLAALLFYSAIFKTYNLQASVLPTFAVNILPDGRTMKGFLIKTEGCIIPDMDPYDPSIKKFLIPSESEKSVHCNKGLPPLVDSNLTSIFVLNSSISSYGFKKMAEVSCCYKIFWREDPGFTEKDTKVKFSEKCVNFSESTKITDEFIMVECFRKSSSVYKDFFAFVPLKKKKADTDGLNVLVIGLDSISRLNFYRQMPLTKGVLENIKAVQLLGYNKVGDNTFPNLIPILTGLSEDELKTNCWPNASMHFDDCPFIWKNFQEHNYLTAFAEDSTWMGLFNYQKRGFVKQPTDYYWDTFNFIAEKQIGNEHKMNVHQCVGSREVYLTLLDYIWKFTQRMKTSRTKYFGFFWESSLSHDFLNKPKLGDKKYAELLTKFNNTGIFNNTALIFLSDHGIRWGAIRSSYQGSMEERMPFIYIKLPDWFNEKYSLAASNLIRNTRRLTTPFDVHETLRDLLQVPKLQTPNFSNRSLSLFELMPLNRTCESGGIASHWCTCQDSTKVSINDSIVTEVADYIIRYVNDLLNGTECLTLKLDHILNARKNGHSNLSKKSNFEDYTVTLMTKPGGAVFESTVRKKYLEKRNSLDVMGTVSRINLYGNQSACTTDFHLKLYCYCG